MLERSEGARPQSPRPQRRVWAGAPQPRPLPPPTPAASRSCARGGAQPGLHGPASVSPLTQWEGWTPVASGGHLRSHPWSYEQEMSARETAPPLYRSQNTLVSRIRDSSAEAAHLPGAPELPRHAGLSPPPRLPRHTPPCCPAGPLCQVHPPPAPSSPCRGPRCMWAVVAASRGDRKPKGARMWAGGCLARLSSRMRGIGWTGHLGRRLLVAPSCIQSAGSSHPVQEVLWHCDRGPPSSLLTAPPLPLAVAASGGHPVTQQQGAAGRRWSP